MLQRNHLEVMMIYTVYSEIFDNKSRNQRPNLVGCSENDTRG